MTDRAVTTLRVSPANERPFIVHVYTAKLDEKLKKYPGAVILGQTDTPAEGIIPTHVGKTDAELKAEKAAAKLVSRNKQIAANREATKAKRKSPRPNNPPQPSIGPLIIDALPVYPPYVGKTSSGKPIVNLTTGEYFPSRRSAENRPDWGENSIKEWLLRHSPARVRDNWFAWATEEEQQARQCLRKIRGETRARRPYKLPEDKSASPTILANAQRSKQYLHVTTGKLYSSQLAICKALGIGKARLDGLKLGQVRHTPAGDIRLANKREREKWMRSLQAHGGQMPIAFNQR